MNRKLLCIALLMGLCRIGSAGESIPLAQPWESAYEGDDATGKHVVALWNFAPGKETDDCSGHGHALKLKGAEIRSQGRFSSCLESFPGLPVADKGHQAIAKNEFHLSPPGAFTLEMWIKLKPEISAPYGDSFLLDKKYVAHDDYQLLLGAADPLGTRMLRACLGFGGDSSTWHSKSLHFEVGVWYHIAFTYDGEGTGSFYVNGTPQGSTTIPGRRQINPGKHPLSIGDRLGSNYRGFPGFLSEVRISNAALEFRPVKLELISSGRTCFVRMERQASVNLSVTNLQRSPLKEALVRISADGMPTKEVKLSDLAPAASESIEYALDTSLRPEVYGIRAQLIVAGPKRYESSEAFDIRIVPRRPPDRFPVLMWGVDSDDLKNMTRLKRMGFTHALGVGADYGKIWEAGTPTEPGKPEPIAQTQRLLDDALANDVSLVASLSPGSWLRANDKYLRVDRQGKAPADKKQADICGLFPEMRQFCYNVGASVAKAYDRFPAFAGSLIHTEVRDAARPCFHPHDREAYRKSSGAEIPPEAGNPRGVQYTRLRDFPASRVIPDNHPIYVYYRWYWKHGDGWNELNTAVHQGLKSTGRSDLWTFHDPAVRVARVYGSGGAVDFISQWTYSYPDPIRIGLATDELLATAAGASVRQQVMKMTQIIWYRSQTAPMPKPGSEPLPYKAAWEQDQPEAPFITIAPMHLREAFWTKIARPIKGIMYHGWGSLVPVSPKSGYRFTNPQTQDELARLTAQVVRPLGPVLLRVPGVKSDVAFLESFASEMFANRGTYGWCGSWLGDAYHVMLYAHLQPEIVLDETIMERGLDGFRVLVMADCDVITSTMAQRIQAFQARGGIIIGDERTAPAIKPDILLSSYARIGRADQDKAALQSIAAGLRKQLDAKYARYADCSDPDVIPYRRRYQDTDYVFLVNDRREFGSYVGQHGLVMEQGLPNEAQLSLARPDGFLYDLVEGRQVPVRREQGKLSLAVRLNPCDGRLYMVTSREIDRIGIRGPATVERGRGVACAIEVVDRSGQPLSAVVPVEIAIRDPEGRVAEFSGQYAAVDGKLAVALDIASNDVPGVWQIDAREMASGRSASHYFRVIGPAPWPPLRKPIPKELANPVQPKG